MGNFLTPPVINSKEAGQQFVERELRQLGITNIWHDSELSWTFAPYPASDGSYSEYYSYRLTLTSDLTTIFITHSNDDHGPFFLYQAYDGACVFTLHSLSFYSFGDIVKDIIKTYSPNRYGLT